MFSFVEVKGVKVVAGNIHKLNGRTTVVSVTVAHTPVINLYVNGKYVGVTNYIHSSNIKAVRFNGFAVEVHLTC